MKIEVVKTPDSFTLSLEGRLDSVSAPQLAACLEENAKEISFLVFQCEKLEYISSAGLRVLLAAHKHLKGAMKLVAVGEVVMDVLEMAGFSQVFTIE